MYKNYFFLNRLVIELNPLLSGKKIRDIFTQDKDKLILEAGNSDSSIFLEICVNPGNNYLTIKENFIRAKKNTFNFFNKALYSTIKGIFIANDDRIISISTSSGNLFFTIRGKYTNAHFIDLQKNIESFVKAEEENIDELITELFSKTYIITPNQLDLELNTEENYFDSIRKKYPIIGKEIIQECKSRSGKPGLVLQNVVEEIFSSRPVVFLNKTSGEINIAFEKFHIYPNTEILLSDDLITALNLFLYKKYYFDEWKKKEKRIRKYIERELNKIASKINNLRILIDKGDKAEEYSKIGNLILINLNNIPAGQKEIELEDIYDAFNRKIKIKLDVKLNTKQNADKYFEKAKGQKLTIENSVRMLTSAQKEYEKYKNLEEKLVIIDSLKELNHIMKELKIKDEESTRKSDDIKSKFKHYLVDNKYHVFVGKDSQNNDLLTTKFAKQNDYWFHARSVSGSHVVLRIDNTKEAVPKYVLKKVASLAAYHSKAKTAGLVPVSFCFKKYVVKKKGMPIGQVILMREDTLLVKPEIPYNCEYLPIE